MQNNFSQSTFGRAYPVWSLDTILMQQISSTVTVLSESRVMLSAIANRSTADSPRFVGVRTYAVHPTFLDGLLRIPSPEGFFILPAHEHHES